MRNLDWQAISALANVLSAACFLVGTIFVVLQLREAARARYVSLTSQVFSLWLSPEFQRDQLFVLHRLPCGRWEEFVADGRGESAESALQRVGGYYDYVGLQVVRGMLRKEEILGTIGSHAVAVWERIEPLVRHYRQEENAFLFQHFEAMLPDCRECYVPGSSAAELEVVRPRELRKLLEQERALVLDVSRSRLDLKLVGAVRAEPNQVEGWLALIQAADSKLIVVYCDCPDDAASRQAARQLLEAGVPRVKVLQGGLKAWQKAGYPVTAADAAG